MPVSPPYRICAIQFVRNGALLDCDLVASKAHRAPHVVHASLLRHAVHDGVLGVRVKLGRVCAGKAANMSCKRDYGELEPKADAKVRYLVFARQACRSDYALAPALAKAARRKYATVIAKRRHLSLRAILELFRVYPVDLDFFADLGACMRERVVNADVTIRQRHVFSDDCYPDITLIV